MFDPVTGHRGIEGKDLGNGWSNSWFPGSFGKQEWNSAWTLYDMENLEAKAVGWDATYALVMSQTAIDRTGERDAIFKAFRAWQHARSLTAFTKAQKLKLRDPDLKFHLEQTGAESFILTPIKQLNLGGKSASIFNGHESQPLQFALRLFEPTEGCTISLPDGGQLKTGQKIDKGHYIICKGSEAYVANEHRKKVADLTLARPAVLPIGESKLTVESPGKTARLELKIWIAGKGEEVKR